MGRFVGFLSLLFALSCAREELPGEVLINVVPPGAVTRSADPSENLITDYNLYIFNSFGFLEKKVYVPARSFTQESTSCTARLLRHAPYMVFAAANLGYELNFSTADEALEYRYHMAYPDEFSRGIPMAVYLPSAVAGDDNVMDVHLERVMARVDLNVDRRGLDEDVSLKVTSVQLCNTASSVMLFDDSYVENWLQLFTEGYSKSGDQIYWLNHDTMSGTSGVVSFYLLENRSGGLVQSYVEVKAEYHSDSCHTRPAESLLYRFYLDEDHDVCRNSLYQLTFKPLGTGLECTDGWSLDKTALISTAPQAKTVQNDVGAVLGKTQKTPQAKTCGA